MALSDIDRNLQTIRNIESGWNLPSLPDPVKFDLAAQPLGPAQLAGFLQGLGDDAEEATRPAPITTPTFDVVPGRIATPQADVASFLTGITTGRPPVVVDRDAVSIWKHRAIQGGYLDPQAVDVNDPRWLPEYSQVAREMSFDSMRKQFAGEKPGSLSLGQVADLMGDWLSPEGLYRAAVNLDLWWDFDAIGDEFAEWGDKWNAWREEPWNPMRLVDAITGPLDDIIFPVLNLALLATGVGSVFTTGRVLYGGAKAGLVASSMRGIYSSTRTGRAIRAAYMPTNPIDEIARLAQPSFIAQRLPEGNKVRNSMEAWRRQNSVIMAKKVNQQAFRLGLTSNLQGLVDDRAGHSIGSATGVDEWISERLSNPLVDWGVDLLFTPTHLFEKGGVKLLGQTAFGPLATPVYRGVAKTADFGKVSQNEAMLMAWYNPTVSFLQENAETVEAGEAAVKAFNDDVKRVGLGRALANQHSAGDVDELSAMMAYVATMGAIDGHARSQAAALTGTVTDMDSTTRGLYLRARGIDVVRMRQFDPDDVDEVLATMARYNTTFEDEFENAFRTSKRGKRESDLNDLRETYLETPEEAAARAGATPDGHVRLYGVMDEGTMRWTDDLAAAGDDPYFVDVSLAEYAEIRGIEEAVARAELSGADVALPVGFHRRYRTVADAENRASWPRLSNAANVRVYKPEALANLRQVVLAHNAKANRYRQALLENLNPEALEAYVVETLPSFGNWRKFMTASDEVQRALDEGIIDNAQLAEALTDNARRLSLFPEGIEDKAKYNDQMFDLSLRLSRDVDLSAKLSKGMLSPLVRDLDVGRGRVTVARLDTPTKQQALVLRQQGGRLLSRLSKWESTIARLDPTEHQMLLDAEDLPAVVAELAEARAFGAKTAAELRAAVRFARKEKVALGQVSDRLRSYIDELSGRPEWSQYGVSPRFATKSDPVARLKEQLKELGRQTQFMAAELEVPEELAARLAEQGYRAVYGVEFALTHDVLDSIPALADVTMKTIHAQGLRQWFGRQDPKVITALRHRMVRSSVWSALKRAEDSGGDLGRIQLGDDFRSESAEVTTRYVMDVLYEVLNDVQDTAMAAKDAARSGGLVRRVATNASLARIPLSVDRLPSDLTAKEFAERLRGYGFTDDAITAIGRGLRQGQHLGFRYHGLHSIETYLRSRPNATNGLRLLGRHEASNRVRGVTAGATATGSMVLGAVVADAQLTEDNPDAGEAAHLLARAGGAIAGKMGATAFNKRVGLVAGEGVGRLAKVADRIDNSPWSNYAYLADGLANMRDLVRFSLSPIFDASRYSEATILSQIGDVPDGLALNLNQSPTAYRRRLAKSRVKEGMDPAEARRAAEAHWLDVEKKFAASARGDFDWEVIDGVGRRFSSVGVLGFSPAHWMASTFGQMVDSGVDAQRAYKAVRDIYTYGTTGRSAAELSMNFVFFPFSFTKKVAGHLTSFLGDDLGRAVLLHDSIKTYQILDEQYNLEELWRDRFPALDRMRRMNILAYGIGVGRFGGVNAPLLESARNLPVVGSVLHSPTKVPAAFGLDGPDGNDLDVDVDGITNLFLPQAVPVHSQQDADNLWDVFLQLLPAMNDVNQLIGSAIEQTYVATSPAHMSADAEERYGWQEWREFQKRYTEVLEKQGLTWSQAQRDPAFAAMVAERRVQIARQYPAWQQRFGDGIAHNAALDLELQVRLTDPKAGAGDLELARFHRSFETLEATMRSQGWSFERPEEVPPEVYTTLRNLATELARQNPHFVRLYNRFYRRTLGDITTEVR